MIYREMTVEEAKKLVGSNAKVLVAIQDLNRPNEDATFIIRRKKDYDGIFNDVKTVASVIDDFVKELQCFTEKQNIYDIKPIGVQKIVLLE